MKEKLLFPNRIRHCILLILAASVASASSAFLYQSKGAETVSVLLFGVVAFLIPLGMNLKRRVRTGVSCSLDFRPLLRETKRAHILLAVYLGATLAYQLLFREQTMSLYLLATVLVGSLVEELVFRFTMLNGLLERYPALRANLVTSALFALMHYNVINDWGSNLYAISNAFILSLLFGWIFCRSKNIVYACILHCAVNTLLLIS